MNSVEIEIEGKRNDLAVKMSKVPMDVPPFGIGPVARCNKDRGQQR
jgi:hypothetical protein